MNMPTGDKILLASEKVHTNILCLRLELLFFHLHIHLKYDRT